MALTELQKRFADLYIETQDPIQALELAGYSTKNKAYARAQAASLLESPDIKAYLDFEREELMTRTGITREAILRNLTTLAFANIKDFVEWDSDGIRLKDSANIPDELAGCIKEIAESRQGAPASVKLYDKQLALDKLAKILGLYEERFKVVHEFSSLSDDELLRRATAALGGDGQEGAEAPRRDNIHDPYSEGSRPI